ITIMGGLLVATALTLLVVPALYALWFRVRSDETADPPVFHSQRTGSFAGDVVRPHYPGRYGGGRDRPTRTRGHAETDGPEHDPASASRRTPVHAGLTPGPAPCMPT